MEESNFYLTLKAIILGLEARYLITPRIIFNLKSYKLLTPLFEWQQVLNQWILLRIEEMPICLLHAP